MDLSREKLEALLKDHKPKISTHNISSSKTDHWSRKKITLPLSKIRDEYENGQSICQMAKIYDVSYSTMRNNLVDSGVSFRPCLNPRGKIWTEVEKSDIWDKWGGGTKPKAIAEEYGVEAWQVSGLLARMKRKLNKSVDK